MKCILYRGLLLCDRNDLPPNFEQLAPSSGIVGLLLALNMCQKVSAFGFHLTTGTWWHYYDENITEERSGFSKDEADDYGRHQSSTSIDYGKPPKPCSIVEFCFLFPVPDWFRLAGAHNFFVERLMLTFLRDYAAVAFH